MSIYDKASLVLIPSGTKTSKVYSQKPVSGDGDFTFSRSTAATRVNASGDIEKETSNLLLQSNSFDTTWVSNNTTETGGQSGYDGTSDAWLLTKSAAYANLNQSVSASGVNTYSLYAKANTLSWLRIVGGSTSAFFDLSNGVVGTTDAGNIAKMTSIGSGWYRCEVAMNASTTIMRIYPAQADNDVTGTSGSIYIQDAQLNQGLIAQEVITTTTTAIYGGITDNVPRLDYTDSSCPALLLEPQRTNLLTHSEYFSDFSLAGGSLTANDTTSPEGFVNAYKFTEDSANSQHRLRKDFAVSAGEHTISLFVKGTSRYLSIYPQTASTAYAVFDLQNETITKSGGANYVSSSIENYGNDWYRIILTCTASASTLKVHFYLSNSGTSEAPTYVGDGSSYLHFYGAQVEAGSYPTSYIPTYGSAVTRNADAASKTGISSLIGQTEGTLFFECTNKALVNQARYFLLSDGTFNNRIDIYQFSEDKLGIYVATSGAAQVSATNVTLPSSGSFKFALAYSNNDYIWYLNGTQIGTDTTGSVPTLTNALFALNAAGGTLGGSGNSPFKQAILFKERLSNAELATLTTI